MNFHVHKIDFLLYSFSSTYIFHLHQRSTAVAIVVVISPLERPKPRPFVVIYTYRPWCSGSIKISVEARYILLLEAPHHSFITRYYCFITVERCHRHPSNESKTVDISLFQTNNGSQRETWKRSSRNFRARHEWQRQRNRQYIINTLRGMQTKGFHLRLPEM